MFGSTPCRLAICLVLLLTPGCFAPLFSKKDENRTALGTRREAIKDKLQSDERPTMVSSIASPAMLTQSRIENIGLVTQLHGTGGVVNASQQREKMLNTMRRANAHMPNLTLDDPATALVVVTGVVGPAARKGDMLDILVSLSSHAEASDLRHGWMLETPLMEMSVLAGEIKEGFDLAKAEGYLVTNQQITGNEDPKAKLEGVIVGGARLLKERDLGIRVDSDYADAITMSAIVPAINKRFTYFDGHKKKGIATPREAGYVEIAVTPRYQHDPYHFINTVLSTSFNETAEQKSERLLNLRKQLNEPTTVREACWELEAIGEESIPMLAEHLNHPDPEVQFYVAHSLAYLNDKRAISKLTSLCLKEPAFRAMCFNGLILIENFEAGDTLEELLHAADPEVKYGAVLAIRKRDPMNPKVTGKVVENVGSLLEIPSSGPPLVAVSLSQTPEIVIFGEAPQLEIPAFHYVNPETIIAPTSDGLTISRFRPGKDDQVVNTKKDLRSILLGIADVGGNYGDWVSFVREAHEKGFFIEPMAMNPVPSSGRRYDRQSATPEPLEDVDLEQTYFDPNVLEQEKESKRRKGRWMNPFAWGK